MVDVDTSSYLKPGTPVNPLDVANKLGSIQAQKLSIDQSKLDQVNQAYTYLAREINSLPADTSHDDMARVVGSAATKGLITPDMANQFINEIPRDPEQIKKFRDEFATKGASIQEAVNLHYGAPAAINNGQTTTPTRQGLRGGPVPSGPPIQNQLPPGTETRTPSGQPILTGPQQPQLPEGTIPVQGGIPGQYQPANAVNRLPVAPTPPVATNAPVRPLAASGMVPGRPGERFLDAAPAPAAAPIRPQGPVTGMSPAFDVGIKQRAEDQQTALDRSNAVKPAMQAYKMLEGLRSGPGTAPFNQAVAFLKANGIIDTQEENDPTAIYQEVNKKLSQYIQNGSGSRSDKDLANKEESSPNVKTQISPALKKLTRDNIALDRVRIAMPTAFEGDDLSKYGNHRATFPTSIDERAFALDMMDQDRPGSRQKLLDEMKRKANTAEGKKFWNSLAIAKKTNIYNVSGE